MAKAKGSGRDAVPDAREAVSARARAAALQRRFDLLAGGRGGAKAGNAVQIRAVVNELRPAMRAHEADNNTRVQHFGGRILWLYRVGAHEALGRAGFAEFLRVDLGLSFAQAYRYVRVAKYASAAQAAWTIDAVLAAADVVELLARDPKLRRELGVKKVPQTISDLAGVPFVLPDGRTLDLGAKQVAAADLELLAATLERRSAGFLPMLSRVQKGRNERLAEALSARPELKGVDARIKRTRKGQRLVVSLVPDADLEAVARVLVRVLAEPHDGRDDG